MTRGYSLVEVESNYISFSRSLVLATDAQIALLPPLLLSRSALLPRTIMMIPTKFTETLDFAALIALSSVYPYCIMVIFPVLQPVLFFRPAGGREKLARLKLFDYGSGGAGVSGHWYPHNSGLDITNVVRVARKYPRGTNKVSL